MGGLTKQPSRLFNLKLVRKHFPEGSNTRPRAESNSQKNTTQVTKSKGRGGSVGSDSSSPGLSDDRSESETSYDDADHPYQYQQTSDDIWNSFFQPGPGETREDVQFLLKNKQYPAQLTTVELGSLEHRPPPPTKPLPAIPIHPRPRTAPQRPNREVEDCPLPAWNHHNTLHQTRKVGATYSPFPKPLPLPPRTSSITPSWKSSRETPKHQRPIRPDITATKQAHHHNAKHYRDMSKEKHKTDEEIRLEAFQELLAQIVRDPPKQKSLTGTCGRDFIRPLDEVIMCEQVDPGQPSLGSATCSDLILPPVEDDWDEFTPILSRPDSSKNLPQTETPSPEPTTCDLQPVTVPEEVSSEPNNCGHRPLGATLESVWKMKSLENRSIEAEMPLRTTTCERPVSMLSTASRSDTHLPLPDSEIHPILLKKSVPDLRTVPKLQPPPLPKLPKAAKATKAAKVAKAADASDPFEPELPTQSVWEEDDDEVRKRFDLFRILHRRGGSEGRRSSKNNEPGYECRRSNTGSEPASPRSPREMWNSMFGRHRK